MEKRKQKQNMQDSTWTPKTRLKCRYCDRSFMFPSVLARHMRKHSNEQSNRCKICKRGFPDKASLSIHVTSHESGSQPAESDSVELAKNLHMQNPMQWLPPLEDPDSQEANQSPDEVQQDTQSSHQRQEDTAIGDQTSASSRSMPFRSQPVIDLTSAEGDRLMKRVGPFEEESAERIFGQTLQQCGGNGKQPSRKNMLKTRVQREPGSSVNAPGTAETSGSALDTQAIPANSQRGHFTLCSDGRALKCNYCSFMCRRTCGRMIKHLRVHGIRSRNQCKSCGLGFVTRSELQSHHNVCQQSSLAPQCPECGKTFSFRSLLRQHMNTHLNKKLYRCNKCPMSFTSALTCQLHLQKQHASPVVVGQSSVHLCSLCPEQFESRKDLDRHLRVHAVEKTFKCTLCNEGFSSASTWSTHIRTAHRATNSNDKDETWSQSFRVRSAVTSVSEMSSIPVSRPVMSMPIVVSVSSQSKGGSYTYSKVVDEPSLVQSKMVDGPSELTAGSPELIDDGLDPGTSGLVYMRKELNPEVDNSHGSIGGPSVLRSWSVSESSDPMASSESGGIQVVEGSQHSSGSSPFCLKKEVSKEEDEHLSILDISRLEVKTGSTSQGQEELPSHRSQQQLEPTSTAAEREVFPVHHQHSNSQYTARSSDSHQRLLDVGNVLRSPSPEGSYGRSTDDMTNAESPCRATSTRRSLDTSDNTPGSYHCNFCDITFGDPIMHYLHMGWHVTADPWKCNGCGQECVGRVDFFLHLYKAGHN
ncbi:zinc finger protein 236-like [Acanthaster planci]|uniref:Zinc finger protein 236-like n=1 Tax=Acanthaster planci TaxID=133434 RepID=A0A8B7Z0G2_ACAPL|nr:zinc finger protein 236-like [Acanthaster planci]